MDEARPRRTKWGRQSEYSCGCCKKSYAFCWTCPCGFEICQECMYENLWGLTCNNVTWTCPDCGNVRSF